MLYKTSSVTSLGYVCLPSDVEYGVASCCNCIILSYNMVGLSVNVF